MGVVGGASNFVNVDTILDNGYLVYIIDATSNNVNITLPASSDVGSAYFKLKRQDSNSSNTVTVSSVNSSTETIDLSPSISMNPGDKFELTLINGLWYTI
jgi:hypothetical protein